MDKLSVFTAITAAAVVLQAFVLVGIFIAVRRTSARMESLAEEVRTRALPAFESAQSLIAESRGPLENILGNLQTTTGLIRNQVQRVDATVGEIVDRTRLQAIRADQMVSRTMDRLERVTGTVHAVVTPARQISGLVQGVSVGIDAFFRGRNRRRAGMNAPNDEMFI